MRESRIIEETSVAHVSPMSHQPRSYAANVFKRNVLQYVDFHLYRQLASDYLSLLFRIARPCFRAVRLEYLPNVAEG